MPASCAAKITIENRIAEIARVLDLIENFAERHQIAAQAAADVAVCVDELLSNTIRLGYPNHEADAIVIALHLDAGELCARIEDNGIPFDFNRAISQNARAPREPSIGGHGLTLVRALVDELAYFNGRASNVTTLTKRLVSR